MLEVNRPIPANLKQREVSAVRDFPKGCGIKVNSKPSPVSIDVNSETSSSLNVPKEEPKDTTPSAEPPKDSEALRAEVEDEGERTEGLAENVVKEDALGGPKLAEGVKVNGYVEKFVCPKRRKVSAVRDFPVGCGGSAPKVGKAADAEFASVASSESKAFDGEKKHVVRNGEPNGEAVSVAVESFEKAEDEGRKKEAEPSREKGLERHGANTIIKSPKVKSLDDGRKKDVEPSRENSYGTSAEATGDSAVKRDGGEVKRNESSQTKLKVEEVSSGKTTVKSPKVKLQAVMEGSSRVLSKKKLEIEDGKNDSKRVRENDKKVGGEAGPRSSVGSSSSESNEIKVSAKEGSGETTVRSPKMMSSGGVRKVVVKQQTASEGSIGISSAEKFEIEARKNDAEQVKENAKKISSSTASAWEDHREKKMLVKYSSEKKLEVCDVKQVGKNLQVKEPRDVRRPSGTKVTDKEGRSLVGRSVNKGSLKSLKDGKNLKRKFSEEVEDEGSVPYSDNLEAYGDRLIVQALMAHENCPWRKGKKSGGIISRSVTPKFKVKKEQDLLGSKPSPASRGLSISQYKNKVEVEDVEDSVPQDSGYEKALTTFNRSRELCVYMPPSVPTKLKSKCSNNEEAVNRNMVKKALRLYQLICRKLLQGEEAKSKDSGKIQRVDLKAASILKENNEWVNHGKIIGNVPGVEVGDEFHYRVELSIIGIHRPFQGGIDYINKDGMVLATSIVASGGYSDDIDSSDVLIYSGSGGNPVGGSGGDKGPGDQKLERGNLALKNSIDAGTPVRVVYGFKEKSDSHDVRGKLVSTFTYDGLYLVESFWLETGSNGFTVFKFQLRKMPGQPEISLKEIKKTKKSKFREGLCVKDISNGKERIPICAVNTVDNDKPLPFKYITKVIYPSGYVKKSSRGCDCTDGCSDSEKCACAMKNGGEIPFNFNGAIVHAKPLIYECGPSCKCPPSCYNRVSQHGIRLPLEIFKTKTRGWGVRSLCSIPSGSFICEYTGEMLQDAEAEQRANDEYLFDIGHNYDDHSLWEGLPSFIPGMQSKAVCETVEDVGFTIDAAEYGNVGRYINHSCSPNLYAQNVLHDHDDKRLPHIMLFAIDNIPPLQELTYHYNYMLDQVRDSEGNIKKKECFCGSPECSGRLY